MRIKVGVPTFNAETTISVAANTVRVEVLINNPAVAAIQYALQSGSEERIQFLRCWNEGEFDAIRNEWPDAPEEVFIGADPLYKPRN